MKHAHYFIFFLYLSLMAITQHGCGDDATDQQGGGGQITGGTCNANFQSVFIEYDYMYGSGDSMYTIGDNYISQIRNAFTLGAGVVINFDSSFNMRVRGTRVTRKTLYKDHSPTLDTFTWQNRRYPNQSRYYMGSIDEFHIDDFPIRMGFTRIYSGVDSAGKRRGWSFVFTGKIENYSGLVNREAYKSYATTHELGHAIGNIRITGSHIDSHGGTHENYCLMRLADFTSTIEPIRDEFKFCDSHTCNIFRNYPLTSSYKAASENYIGKKINTITYELSLNKSSYVEIEPIIIKLTVKNNGSNTDSISFYDYEAFLNNLEVTSENNDEILSVTDISDFFKIPYTKIEPGEEIIIEAKLQQSYGNKFLNELLYFSKGVYTVRYHSEDRKNYSNKIYFTVTEPEGVDIQVLNEVKKLITMEVFDFGLPENKRLQVNKIEAKFEFIKTLMNKYPANTYTEEIYNMYNMTYGSLGMKEDIIDKNMWFIKNYPNSFYVRDIMYRTMHAIYHFRNGDEDVFKVLDMITQDYPNTVASEVAQEFKNNRKYQN